MNLDGLIKNIELAHENMQRLAIQQVNYALSLRNWLVGYYIVEFEQGGSDKALFGEELIKRLSLGLKHKGFSATALKLSRQVYMIYPQFGQTLSDFLKRSGQTASDQFQIDLPKIVQTPSAHLAMASKSDLTQTSFPPETLLSRLSYSHFIELVKAENALQRAFYEVEAIKNNWSVRELKRAMTSLLFERTGMSADKQVAISKAKDAIPQTAADIIKNPYVLEFLGLQAKPEFTESDLENAIITHLQSFLVEMGRGFCFEARQKRITFDNKHYFIDLVFYHRILKCHVLLDLKIGEFDHADAGQMNMYLNYFKDNEGTEGDNAPIGIILCAQKNDTLVKYATGGLAQELFVGKYLLQLPSEEELKQLIERDKQEFTDNNPSA